MFLFRPVNETWTKYRWHDDGRVDKAKGSRNPQPPFRFQLVHGRREVAVRWEFVYYVAYDSEKLLMWMANTLHGDELFYSTLNHNPHKLVPGSYTGVSSSYIFIAYSFSMLIIERPPCVVAYSSIFIQAWHASLHACL